MTTEATPTRIPGTLRWGLLLALATALLSGVSIWINAFAVKQLPDPAVYTTVKNGVAAVLLAALAAASVRPATVRAIDRPALTRKFCGGKQQGVENAFVEALGQTEFLEQTADRLTFLSAARQPLLVWQPLRASGQARALPTPGGKHMSARTRARTAKAHKLARQPSLPKRWAKRGCLF